MPSAEEVAYPESNTTAGGPTMVTIGEPIEVGGFRYAILEVRRWDRSSSDDGWCLAVEVEEQTPEGGDPEVQPLAGWELRDGAGEDYSFAFGCQDGTPTPAQPRELSDDELDGNISEGVRFWITFEVLDASEHLWLVRSREVDGYPEIATQLQ